MVLSVSIRFYIFLYVISYINSPLCGQNKVIDSLKAELQYAKHDTSKCNILLQLSEMAGEGDWPIYNEQLKKLSEEKIAMNNSLKKVYQKFYANALNNAGYLASQNGDNANAIEYYLAAIKNMNEINDKNGLVNALLNLGSFFLKKGDVKSAMNYYTQSLNIATELGDNKAIANLCTNIGMVYFNNGDITRALSYFMSGLSKQEIINDEVGVARSHFNIAIILEQQGDVINALKFFEKALIIRTKLGDEKGLASCYNEMGALYQREKKYKLALNYYNKGLDIREKISDKKGIAGSLNNIATLHILTGDSLNGNKSFSYIEYNKALILFKTCLKINEEFEFKLGVAYSLRNIANAYFKLNKIQESLFYGKKCLTEAQRLGNPEIIASAAQTMHSIYITKKNFKNALTMRELHVTMSDSIKSATNKKASIKSQLKYEFDKKAAADSIAHAKNNEVKNALLSEQIAEIKAKKNVQRALFGGLALVIVFAGFMYNRFKVTQKQKSIIEIQKSEVEEQKKLVEEKQKEILDSIQYARRIQMAQIPNEKHIAKMLKKSRT